jgi:hypothetical protein
MWSWPILLTTPAKRNLEGIVEAPPTHLVAHRWLEDKCTELYRYNNAGSLVENLAQRIQPTNFVVSQQCAIQLVRVPAEARSEQHTSASNYLRRLLLRYFKMLTDELAKSAGFSTTRASTCCVRKWLAAILLRTTSGSKEEQATGGSGLGQTRSATARSTGLAVTSVTPSGRCVPRPPSPQSDSVGSRCTLCLVPEPAPASQAVLASSLT